MAERHIGYEDKRPSSVAGRWEDMECPDVGQKLKVSILVLGVWHFWHIECY